MNISHQSKFVAARLLIAAMAAALASFAAPALAAGTWYVAPGGSDANDCLSPATACQTIGGAIGKAAPGDTIAIAAGTYQENLILTAGFTLVGAGAKETVIDGGGRGGVLSLLSATASVTISGVTIRGGRSVGSGGGISSFGPLTLIDSVVEDNQTVIGEGFQGLGGGIASFGPLTLRGVTVSGNRGVTGGGIYNRGALVAENSTISGNAAQQSGGGIANAGTGTLSLRHVTVAGNQADSDSNGSGSGGGIASEGGAVTIVNALLGGNSAGDASAECSGTVTARGPSLVQTAAGCTLAGDTAAVITGMDPLLGPLADNGGQTPTHALLAGSPAIDAGDAAGCLPADQRGVERPQGAGCDVGAFEAEAPAPADQLYVAQDGDDANDCRSPQTPCATIGAAIALAAGGDTVNVGPGTYTDTLTIDRDLTIIGAGGGQRVLTVAGGATSLVARGVTLRGGQPAGSGGAVENRGHMTLADSAVRQSAASAGEDGSASGGGIANFGHLTVEESVVAGNAAFIGGGIANFGVMTATLSLVESSSAFIGGGIANFGTAAISGTTVRSNAAFIGGGIANFGVLRIGASTLSGNAAFIGGGIANFGVLTVENSTISGNAARDGGGGIANLRAASLRLSNATITGNIADDDGDGSGGGGGILNDAGSAAVLSASLLAGNLDRGGETVECDGQLDLRGVNLIQHSDGCDLRGDVSDAILNLNPLLGPLADNGGPTWTHALLTGSPVIGVAGATCPAVDQRGIARATGRCSIGAFEPAQQSYKQFLALVQRQAAERSRMQ